MLVFDNYIKEFTYSFIILKKFTYFNSLKVTQLFLIKIQYDVLYFISNKYINLITINFLPFLSQLSLHYNSYYVKN